MYGNQRKIASNGKASDPEKTMRLRSFGTAIISTLIASSAFGQGTASLNAAQAEKMAQACVAYARAHKGAVNIWVYDSAGEVLHFERMDGAPAIGSPVVTGPAILGSRGPSGTAVDPNAFDLADPGYLPINRNGRNIGGVRVAGMGPAGDRPCARAAADAGASVR
jgi:uncharacterized protein GlcG (DUF336 family)